MLAKTRLNSWQIFGSVCGLVALLPHCHPSVSLGGDSGVQGGGHSSAPGESGKAGAHSASTGGTISATTTWGGSEPTGGAISQTTSGSLTRGGTNPTAAGGNQPTGGATSGGAMSSNSEGGSPSTSGALGTGGAMVVVIGGAPGTGGAMVLVTGGSPSTGGVTSQAGGGGVPATGSQCFQLTEAQCRTDLSCAAVLGPDARRPECTGDERGFGSCITGGCRDANTQCNKLETLDLICSATCTSRNWSINPDYGCPGCVCVDDVKIPPAGKGWDIAAWLEADGWHYSLVGGTNRIKTCDEVKIHTSTSTNGTVVSLALPNLVAVKAALTRISAGGTDAFVMLCDRGCPDIGCQLDTMPAEIVQDIKAFATALGLTLNAY